MTTNTVKHTPADTREWQDISTAPKDGSALLLCVAGYEPAVGRWTDHGWDYQSPGNFADEAHWDAWVEATGPWKPDYWLPLPPAPQAKGRG